MWLVGMYDNQGVRAERAGCAVNEIPAETLPDVLYLNMRVYMRAYAMHG